MFPALPFQLCWCHTRWLQGFLPILLTWFFFSPRPPSPADAWGKTLSVPSDHRRAKLACPSRPSFLFCKQRMPSKRELTPPLCTLNQPLPFANFCFFQKKEKKTRDRPRSERQRTPKTSGPGERVEHRRRQNHPQPPRPLCSPFLHFQMGLRMHRCRRGPLPGTGRLEMEPKGTGGPRTPGCCLRGAAGEPRHRWRLGTRSWRHLRCCWQPGPAH